MERLSALRDEVREELSRLRGVLDGELERAPVGTAPDDDLFGPAGRDVAGPEGNAPHGDAPGGDPLTGRLQIATAPAGIRPRPERAHRDRRDPAVHRLLDR